MQKITRSSNFELMRILSMFMIVMGHCIVFGYVMQNCKNEMLTLSFTLIQYFLIIHVNSFVLTTGYFQYNKNIKASKIISLLDSALFWKAIIMMILIAFNLIHPNQIEIFNNVFILDTGQYWFINVYVLLYLISPCINKLLEQLDQKKYKNLLWLLFIIMCFIPNVFPTETFGFENNGYTLYNFIYIYLIGAYLRKHPLKEQALFKEMSINKYRLCLILGMFLCAISNFLLNYFLINSREVSGNLYYNFASKIAGSCLNYSSPLVVIQSICYFLFFETLNLKSKFINKVSTLTTGIYLIHMNQYLKNYLYIWFKIDNGAFYGKSMLLRVFISAVIIFVICALLEYLRQVLFKFIYNRKLSIKWRNFYRPLLDDCFTKINW